MKYANSVQIRVFAKEGEDAEKIMQGLKEIAPFDYGAEKIQFEIRAATGFNEARIKIYNIKLEKERHTKKFLENLIGKLSSEQKQLLLRQKESRLDNELDFFIRLDKEKLINNEYWITDSGNCYHTTISIAAFPRNREVALNIIEKMLA